MQLADTVAGQLVRWRDWLLCEEGSARALGLMRIGTGLMVWARFADRFVLDARDAPFDQLLCVGFLVASTLLLLGFHGREAAACVGSILLYCIYSDDFRSSLGWSSNNLRLISLTALLFLFTPCDTSYSVSRWLRVRASRRHGRSPPTEVVPLWSTRLFIVLLSSVYLSTFLDKTSLSFLSGEKLQAIFASHYTGSDYLDAWWWTIATQGTAIVVWFLEGLLVFGLFVPRLRPWLIVSGIALHLTFYMAFRVYAFSTNMILLYLAFVPPETVKRITDMLTGFDVPRPPSEHAVPRGMDRHTDGSLVFRGAVLVSLLGGALTVAVLQLSEVPLDQRLPRLSILPSTPLEAADDETPAPSHKTREMQRWSPRY